MTPSTDHASAPLTVGFDLDLTLVDTRPGIRAAWEAFSAESGVPVDADLVVNRLGPPLEHEMAHWVPADRVTEMVARYRALYPAYAIEPSAPMPGARDAIRAVREAGGRTIVVTAKNGPHAELHLTHLGIEPDALVGGLWAEGKAEALRAHGAQVYVGDHIGDVRGAATAGALSVAVATGPCAPEELAAAGADVVLTDLTDFRAWWEGYLA
ncbi:phosphoglycolate phosphatase [Streptomyces sp. PvR006]|uniref:HAD family hydrolase n=1 Tax=unclassified Streptomyces TaxID=2593676 RepID=UPI00093DBF38|nr:MULTISPECIES: HAD family hydrolase [unclassified Streptomyces]MBP2583873.1 phosphoglycolate phosphatase [Streptomyces sp. PvR006]MCD2465271.1 HAD family hydrolase [Streptomyces sp. MBT42]OKJ60189.1 haloacid dehalogenase [Streptomyces sp. CB02009]